MHACCSLGMSAMIFLTSPLPADIDIDSKKKQIDGQIVASTQHLSWRVHRTQSVHNGNDENVKVCYINRQEKVSFF